MSHKRARTWLWQRMDHLECWWPTFYNNKVCFLRLKFSRLVLLSLKDSNLLWAKSFWFSGKGWPHITPEPLRVRSKAVGNFLFDSRMRRDSLLFGANLGRYGRLINSSLVLERRADFVSEGNVFKLFYLLCERALCCCSRKMPWALQEYEFDCLERAA